MGWPSGWPIVFSLKECGMAKGTNYVFSTLANDQKYQNWVKGDGVNIPGEFVNIKGGAGMAVDGGAARIATPLGIGTEVSDEQLAILQANVVFQLHQKNGFIIVRSKHADAEKVAADMNRKDPGAPIVPGDYANAGENDPKVQGL
jgi:hypothetical protein